MTEHKAVGKENEDIRQEVKEAKAELRISREVDRKAAKRLSTLEDERTELREDII